MNLFGGVFSMKKVAYSVETKNKVIEMRIQGYSTKRIMDNLNIKIGLKYKDGGNGIEMVKVTGFLNKSENNIHMERELKNSVMKRS